MVVNVLESWEKKEIEINKFGWLVVQSYSILKFHP